MTTPAAPRDIAPGGDHQHIARPDQPDRGMDRPVVADHAGDGAGLAGQPGSRRQRFDPGIHRLAAVHAIRGDGGRDGGPVGKGLIGQPRKIGVVTEYWHGASSGWLQEFVAEIWFHGKDKQ
jgi:hypothetical protein